MADSRWIIDQGTLNRAYGHGSIDIGFNPVVFGCQLGEANAESPILINLRMTGPDTSVAYSVWYALSTSDPALAQIVFIGEVRTETKFVAPGKGESVHYFSFYLPSQDVEPADGFPDEGETPACSAPVPIYTLDTRLPAPGFFFAKLEWPPRVAGSNPALATRN